MIQAHSPIVSDPLVPHERYRCRSHSSSSNPPAKAKTLSKLLGSDYDVRASVGHVSDLPSKGLNIDTENGFKPTYELTERGKTVVKETESRTKKSAVRALSRD